jgi:hypothetical protein
MLPAFSSTWELVGWIVALATILALPVLTTYAVNSQTRYLVMSKRVGPTDWHANQILKETAPLDILFLGNSRMLAAIDHATLQQEFQKRGRRVTSATIGAQFNAQDLSYTYLRDFFDRRKARLVIVQAPEVEFPQTDSNPSVKYIRTLRRRDPGLDLSRPALAAPDYGEMALIGPRLLLASVLSPGPIVRGVFNFRSENPNLEETLGTVAPDWGYRERDDVAGPRTPFVTADLPDGALPAILIRPGAPIPPGVVLIDNPLSPTEAAYLPAIKALCSKNNAKLAFMYEPFADHQNPNIIEVPRQLLALDVPIIAETRNRMFGDATIEKMRQYYSDYFHFNSNGSREGTRLYAPAIESLLAKLGAS